MTKKLLEVWPDRSVKNADWTKRTWDLPTDAPGFLDALGVADEPRLRQRQRVNEFMEQKPAAGSMPSELREELERSGLLEPVTYEDRDDPLGREATGMTMGTYEGIPEQVTGKLIRRHDKRTGDERVFIEVERDGRKMNVSVWPSTVRMWDE